MLFIASWNVNRNNLIDDAKLRLFKDIDIILLQEVNQDSLNFLMSKSNFFDIYYAKEKLSTFSYHKTYYLVTLIRKKSVFVVNNEKAIRLTTVQPLLYKIIQRKILIEYLSLELSFDGKIYHLVNCHLQFACSPSVRRRQFREITDAHQTHQLIVGGDLNLFISPPLSFLFSFLVGISPSELLANERNTFFGENTQFRKPPNESTTIYRAGKLDYILLPDGIHTTSEVLNKKRMNSDHFPVISSINL